MNTIWMILLIAGKILLGILIAILILLLLVLLVPVRYKGAGKITDPEAREEFDREALLTELTGSMSFSWLFHLVGGRITYPENPHLILRIAFVKIDVMEALKKEEPSPSPEKKEEETKHRKFQLRELYARIKQIGHNISSYLKVLQKDETGEALRHIGRLSHKLLVRILPGKWIVSGSLGLGDPQKTGQMMGVLGMSIPLTAGHIFLTPEFEGWMFDLNAAFQGKIRLVWFLILFVRIWFKRNVSITLKRFRRIRNRIAREEEKMKNMEENAA